MDKENTTDQENTAASESTATDENTTANQNTAIVTETPASKPNKGLKALLAGLIGGILYFALFATISYFQAINTPCDTSAGECLAGFAWLIIGLPLIAIISVIMSVIFGLVYYILLKTSKTKDGKPNRYQPYIMIIVLIIALFISYLLLPIK